MDDKLFTNYYQCNRCSRQWTDEGSAGAKGYCVECRTYDCNPYYSEEAPLFLNHYRCWRCKHKWQDEWTATSDDECPECEARDCTPIRSENLNEAAVKLSMTQD